MTPSRYLNSFYSQHPFKQINVEVVYDSGEADVPNVAIKLDPLDDAEVKIQATKEGKDVWDEITLTNVVASKLKKPIFIKEDTIESEKPA